MYNVNTVACYNNNIIIIVSHALRETQNIHISKKYFTLYYYNFLCVGCVY